MTRSLLLSVNVPSPRNGGAALRNAQTVRALARLGPVDLVSIGVTPGETEGDCCLDLVDRFLCLTTDDLERSRSAGDRRRARAWPLRPGGHWRLDQYRSRAALRQVRAFAQHAPPDLVVASQWPMADYAEAVAGSAQLVFDTHNVETALRTDIAPASQGRPSATARLASYRLRRRERDLGRAADEIWMCSEDDAAEWRRIHGDGTRLRVVPNTVPLPSPPSGSSRNRSRIVLTGTFSYRPNADAAVALARDILPLVRRSVPDADLEIVGRQPSADVLALHAPDEGVNVIGPVPDVRPHLDAAGVLVVPLRSGGGTRLKILEAMAAGLPVVTTPKGAEGIDLVDGEDALLASTTGELASACIALMRDPSAADRIGAAGRRLVERRYSSAALDDVVAEAAAEMGVA